MSNPNTPNPDQLEFIHSRQNPRTNAASYGDVEEDFVKEPYPTIILGPNAVYLTDASYYPKKAEEIKEEIGEKLPPTLSSLEPNTLPVWAQDTEVFWKGSGFTETSMIMWSGAEEPTKLIDEHTLSTIVKPSTVQAPLPFSLETYVVDSGKETSRLTFTFIT